MTLHTHVTLRTHMTLRTSGSSHTPGSSRTRLFAHVTLGVWLFRYGFCKGAWKGFMVPPYSIRPSYHPTDLEYGAMLSAY
eukprot:367150-Rhodomonas_salina.2